MKGLLTITTSLLLCLSVITGCKDDSQQPQETARIDTIPMMVQQIQECSKLYTAEYKVHKIVTHSDKQQIRGNILGKKIDLTLPTGDRKVAIPLDATLKAYIDFSEFREENIRREGDKIEVILPQPHVVLTATTIDHEGIRQQVSLLRSNFSDEELSNYEQQGRQAIIDDVPRLGILQTARRSAATQIIPVITMMGFKQEDIIITFIEPAKEKGGITWIMDSRN